MNWHLMNIHDLTPQMIETISIQFPNRYANAMKFKQENDRLRSLTATYLLKQTFPMLKESDILFNGYGKPFFKDGPSFNLSHSGDLCVIAQDEFEIGIDVEIMDEKNLQVCNHVFAEDELVWMQEEPLTRFHILWTQKEALVKAVGKGMNISLNTFSVMPFQNQKNLEYDNRLWQCETIRVDSYIISIVKNHI